MRLHPRLLWKVLLCKVGLGSRLIEFCYDCGIRQPVVWWSQNELWERVTGYATPNGDNAPGLFCPTCFDRRARALGISLCWVPELGHPNVVRPLNVWRVLMRLAPKAKLSDLSDALFEQGYVVDMLATEPVNNSPEKDDSPGVSTPLSERRDGVE